ncbi:MAG: PstS family phosphate ABC transporter substrate-binding protein [Spirochaetota bacterium]
MKNKLCILLFVSALIIIATAGCAKKSTEPVVIHGSTTIEPVLVTLADAFKQSHGISFQIEANGSQKGIQDLIDGKCQIADSSYRITSKQRQAAEKEGVRIREFHLAYDIIVPIVHPANPTSSITMEQLRGIYTGRISTWKHSGWNDVPIRVVSRDENSGTFHEWKKKVLRGGATPSQSMIIRSSNSSVLAYVAENRQSIGYISNAFVNNEVKPLAVNGVKPGTSNEKDTRYPIRRRLYVYVDTNNLSVNTKKFLLYILSGQGQKIIKEEGFITAGSQYKDENKIKMLLSGE